jgi:hypothetical protein
MKSLLVLLAVALLSVGFDACGSASKDATSASHTSSTATTNDTATTNETSTTPPPATTTSSNTTTSGGQPKDSNDDDSDAKGDDDLEIIDYGQAANAADRRTVTTLLKRYYPAAAADNGAAVCSLTFSLIAEEIVEVYGEAAGPANLRGKTCAVVESKALKQAQEHKRMVADAATLEVTGVRTIGKKGIALVRFGPHAQPRYVVVRREFGVWKVYSMSDSRMP